MTGMHAVAALLNHAAVSASQPTPLPGFLAPVGRYVTEYGFWAIFLFVMLEDFGVPLPGETILIAGAIDAGTGRLNIVAVGVIGFAAAVIGDNIGFAIGHFGGRSLALRWGKYVFLTEERLGKAERFFDAHGGKVITIARFVEGLRQANGIIAGIIGMRWLRFLAFNALGAALWVGCWVSVGYYGGKHITTIYDYISQYSLYALIAAAVAVIAWIAARLRGRQRARAALAAELESAAGSTTAREDHATREDSATCADSATRRGQRQP
jgi:membrane protein DedA with SNARE-associated domain